MIVMLQQLTCMRTWLEVEPTTTVLELKHMFSQKREIPVALLKFLAKGQELQDDRTLADYEINEEATIYVLMKKIEKAEAI